MLTKLKIVNFLLIDSLELDFNHGLTVVTGETGSGKSIIIDALMLLFGGKITESLHPNKNKDTLNSNNTSNPSNTADNISPTLPTTIEAEFIISNATTQAWLVEHDLHDIDHPDHIICRRIIDYNNRSKTYINGHAVTLGQIRLLGDVILDIHTQHASITLLKNDMQRKLLDEYANISAQTEQLHDLYKTIQKLEADVTIAHTQLQELNINKQYLQDAITEITNLNLAPQEWQELGLKHKQLAHASQLMQELNEIHELLTNQDNSILTNLYKLTTKFNKMINYCPKIPELIKFINSAEVELHELQDTINDILNNIDQTPDALILLEERINQIFAASRQYRTPPENLHITLCAWQQELTEIDNKTNIELLQQQLEQHHQEYAIIAKQVSTARTTVARKLSQKITQLLGELSIRGEFVIQLTQLANGLIGNYGLETVEFQVCFNRGMPLSPLARAASGGELSRAALALYLTLSIHNPPEVIIFDEIDVGIGGKIAATVGQMLHDLGRVKQIICITHQPQTASFGNMHLVVTKQDQQHPNNTISTITSVTQVTSNNRVNEIARMLGGIEITDTTLEHAREMLGHPAN